MFATVTNDFAVNREGIGLLRLSLMNGEHTDKTQTVTCDNKFSVDQSNGAVMTINSTTITAQAFFETRLRPQAGGQTSHLADGTLATDRLSDGTVSKQDYTSIRNDFITSVLGMTPEAVTANPTLLQQVDEQVACLLSGALSGSDDSVEALRMLASHDNAALAVRFAAQPASGETTPVNHPSMPELVRFQDFDPQTYRPGQDRIYAFETEVSFEQVSQTGGASIQSASAVMDQPFQIATGQNEWLQHRPPKLPDTLSFSGDTMHGTFRLSDRRPLGPSRNVGLSVFDSNPKDPLRQVTVLAFDPHSVDFRVQTGPGQKGVCFDRGYPPQGSATGAICRNESLSIASQPNLVAAMNGVTMVPTGDMYLPQGDSKSNVVGTNQTEVHHLAGNNAAANSRYRIDILTDGTVRIGRGGIQVTGPHDPKLQRGNNGVDPNSVAYSLNGAALLFDKTMPPANAQEFAKQFAANNDSSMVVNMKGSLQENKQSPRSLLGILPDGKVLMVTLGGGSHRPNAKNPNPQQGGCTAYDAYLVMRQLGCVQAVMLDGGGAPGIVTQQGMQVPSQENDGYAKNGSFFSIFEK